TSPPIAIPANATLTFNYVLQSESGTSYDRAEVQISTNGGSSYTAIATKSSILSLSSSWRAVTSISLAAYAGQTVLLRWSFNTVDSGANSYEGWYVDDIQIASPAVPFSDYYSFTLGAGDSATLALK